MLDSIDGTTITNDLPEIIKIWSILIDKQYRPGIPLTKDCMQDLAMSAVKIYDIFKTAIKNE